MKKIMTIILSIVLCVLSFVMPSFALIEGDYEYEIVDDTVTITKYIGTATTLTIPATIDGVEVSKIGDGAFKDNASLKTVTVSNGIKDIGSSAFENCTSLSKISLPDTIIHIGEKAIYNTAYYNDTSNWKLKNTAGNDDGTIEWEDISAPVLEYLYLDKVLIEIELKGIYSVKYGTLVIADGAFKGNAGAIDVGLPESIVSIGCGAFEGCVALKGIRKLELAKNIGDNAFKDCVSLEEINIAEAVEFNANAISNTGYYNNSENWENGVLYMGARVVGTSSEFGEIVIKHGTTTIVGGALENKDTVIPTTVTNISNNAFISTENAKIFGYSDTPAQVYAKENNLPFIALDKILKGDVNFDGVISSLDYDTLVRISGTIQSQSYAISIAGDMDDDGAVDGIDVIILQMIIKNMPLSRLKGDVNGDGVVNRLDYDLLIKIVATTDKITDNVMFKRADINEDGAVDGFDAVYLDLALKGYTVLI